jgi:hypothetical protein
MKIEISNFLFNLFFYFLCIGFSAGTELVPELQTHMPNWFPFEKVILLGIAELVPV